ncbi:hypothetical protein, partial [Paracraurococcus lichenis]
LLEEVPDHRRAEGKVYQLAYVLLFSILAIVSGGCETIVAAPRGLTLAGDWLRAIELTCRPLGQHPPAAWNVT